MRGYPNSLLSPDESVVLLIDHQPQMIFGVCGQDRARLLSNVVALAEAAKTFRVPCILTTVEAAAFSGSLLPQIQAVYPEVTPIDRTFINAWEDPRIKDAVAGTGRKRLILSGLWTEACVTFPAMCALEDGYQVFAVTDACGGSSKEAHDMAVMRMVQAGVEPVTWQQVMLEWQRDWANKDTYDAVMGIVKGYGDAYGAGVEYAETMMPKA
jgi:nicotinamidase-related amidase